MKKYIEAVDGRFLIDLVEGLRAKDRLLFWDKALEELNEIYYPATKNAWRNRYRKIIGYDTHKNRNRRRDSVMNSLRVKNYEFSVNDEKVMVQYLCKPHTAKEAFESRVVRFNSELEAYGFIKGIEDKGIYGIDELKQDGKTLFQVRKTVYEKKKTFSFDVGESVAEEKIMVISDSHIGSKIEQLTFINGLYDLAVKEGIKSVYHCGDITDGYYPHRGEQVYNLCAIGFDEQAKRVVKNYPKRDGVTTYFIIGNHDETHIRNGGANIGRKIAEERPDMVYLGDSLATIMMRNVRVDLLHPQDGSSKIISYSGQTYMDTLHEGDLPDILFCGHHHKCMYYNHRNIHYFEVPSTCLQSAFERLHRLQNQQGAWIIDIHFAKDGTLSSLSQEFVKEPNALVDDWKNYENA